MKRINVKEIRKIVQFLINNADMGSVMDYDDEYYLRTLMNSVYSMAEGTYNLMLSAAEMWLSTNKVKKMPAVQMLPPFNSKLVCEYRRNNVEWVTYYYDAEIKKLFRYEEKSDSEEEIHIESFREEISKFLNKKKLEIRDIELFNDLMFD